MEGGKEVGRGGGRPSLVPRPSQKNGKEGLVNGAGWVRNYNNCSLIPRCSINRRERLLHTVCACAAPQVFLESLETSIKSTPLHSVCQLISPV